MNKNILKTKTLASPGDSNPKNLSKLGETEDGYLAPQKLEVENGYLLPMKALPNETEAPSQGLFVFFFLHEQRN